MGTCRLSLGPLCRAILTAPALAQTAISLATITCIMVPEPGHKSSQPEPWLAPKYKSPRGTPQTCEAPDIRRSSRRRTRRSRRRSVCPPKPGGCCRTCPRCPGRDAGRRDRQDRALRCAHQAGVYGQAAGGRGNYARPVSTSNFKCYCKSADTSSYAVCCGLASTDLQISSITCA